jgi:hypothetical protein
MFAGVATGSVIIPPRPVIKPYVAHLAICQLIRELAISTKDLFASLYESANSIVVPRPGIPLIDLSYAQSKAFCIIDTVGVSAIFFLSPEPLSYIEKRSIFGYPAVWLIKRRRFWSLG